MPKYQQSKGHWFRLLPFWRSKGKGYPTFFTTNPTTIDDLIEDLKKVKEQVVFDADKKLGINFIVCPTPVAAREKNPNVPVWNLNIVANEINEEAKKEKAEKKGKLVQAPIADEPDDKELPF